MEKLTISQIINQIPNGKGKIDSAIPIDWAADAKDINVDPGHFVWDYRGGGAPGRPLNIMAEHVRILEEMNQNLTLKIIELNEELDEIKIKRASNGTV